MPRFYTQNILVSLHGTQSFFEENSENMIAFHFHALEISSNEFSTGFNK